MGEKGEIDLTAIVDPERTILVFINFHMEIFDRIFSKLEVINAMEYLDESTKMLGIPRIYVNTLTPNNERVTSELEKYNNIKDARRRSRTAPESILDPDLNRNFEKYAAEQEIICHHQDLFSCGEFVDRIKLSGKRTIMLAGFFTELDILRTSAACIDHGYYGVTVSDATSTYSERIYYQALDLISQTTEVIDTRDLMRIWP